MRKKCLYQLLSISVVMSLLVMPITIINAEIKGYYDPQYFNLELNTTHTCWPQDAKTTTREAYSVSVYVSDCWEKETSNPDEVRVIIIRRTDLTSQDIYTYYLEEGESTPTINGNGYPLEIHIQWANNPEEGGDGEATRVIGYINWFMN